jgi:magnesium-transporting ATPase (P-type)
MPTTPIQAMSIPEVLQAMDSSPEGLSSAEAETRLSLYGRNSLYEQPKTPFWQKIIDHFRHPLIWVTVGAAIIAALIGDWVLALVILILSFANIIFLFWREYRAEQAIQKLQLVLPAYAHVIRNGQETYENAQDVVPGDVLILAEGDNIPADARVIEEYGLRTNNSTLTGEAVPSRKMADPSFLEGRSELEQPNLIFAGTSVAAGTGKAVVYATGMLTQFGRIAHLTQFSQEPPSRLKIELERTIGIITWAAIGIAGLILLIGYADPAARSRLFDPRLLALGVLVAAIPEGLPVTLTLSLAMAVQRLAQKGVLAKKLNIVETLGNVSVICTDKSGTLTQNQMTVREVWVSRQRIKVTGVGYEPQGEFVPLPAGKEYENDFKLLLKAATCCNNARVIAPSLEHPFWTNLGDQTEAALKVAALKNNINEHTLEAACPRIHEIPFDARRKRMTTIHMDTDKEVAFVKGAPREILQLCTHVRINNAIEPLTDSIRAEILTANDDYARNALRVLALASRELPAKAGSYAIEAVEHDLTFLGLMAMMDPPRPEVESAIRTFREAGIRIVMITGDYGLTAESLARRVGMLTTPNPRILTGQDLETMSEPDLSRILEQEVLFARMAPEHKLRLVSAYQSKGNVVAVTGDGVNDAPALRKADVGVAMGVVGTDVAKEAADIILTDDNFGAIVYAIEEGRAVYDNIRKFLTYIFSSNVPELVPFLVTSLFPIPLALTVRQILAVDLGTDLMPALGLGVERPEPGIMQKPPRSSKQTLVDGHLLWRSFGWLGMIEVILCYAGFFAVFYVTGNLGNLVPLFAGVPIPEYLYTPMGFLAAYAIANTVYHVGVVTAQAGNVFACRTDTARNSQIGWFSNKYIWIGIGIELIVIFLLIYIPTLAGIFNHVAIPLYYWPGLFMYAVILYSLEWLRKALIRRRSGNSSVG